MKIVVAGGHGQIALRLERLLSLRGDEVAGLIRDPDHANDLREAGAEPVLCDLERAAAEEVTACLEGADAVVFAAGAGPGSGEARKETMDLGGAVKLIEAAKAMGVSRYVMISSMGANPDAQGEGFAAYLRAKGRADAALVESGLAYTIVRPGRLTNDSGTGLVTIGESVRRAEIPRDGRRCSLRCSRVRTRLGSHSRLWRVRGRSSRFWPRSWKAGVSGDVVRPRVAIGIGDRAEAWASPR